MAAPQWAQGPDGKTKKWAGGRIKLVNGVERYVIERKVGPTRFSITLDPMDLETARAELALFNRSPASYRSPQRQRTDDVMRAATMTGAVWTDDMVSEFLRYARARVKAGKLSERYVDYTLDKYLTEWTEELGGRDLRTLRITDLRKALKRWRGVAEDKRITAIKAFTAWLRSEGKLDRKEDATLDLEVPQAEASKDVHAREYPILFVEVLYRMITLQSVRDSVLLRVKANGMHHTEIQRLPKSSLRVLKDPSGIYGEIVFAHLKKDGKHSVSVDAQTFAAAERIARNGAPDHKTVWKHLQLAFAALPTETRKLVRDRTITPERLRHSFGTWAHRVGVNVEPSNQSGLTLDQVAEHMGHTKKATTRKHYIGDVVRPMVVLPIRLEHPEDPAPPEGPPVVLPAQREASRP